MFINYLETIDGPFKSCILLYIEEGTHFLQSSKLNVVK